MLLWVCSIKTNTEFLVIRTKSSGLPAKNAKIISSFDQNVLCTSSYFQRCKVLFFYNGDSAKSGIYEIRNRLTNRSYIGQSGRITKRWQDHKKVLSSEKKTNKFLLADYKKCKELLGHDDFLEFHIIEVLDGISRAERLQKEEHWIEQAIAVYGKQSVYNFNCKPTAEMYFFSSKGPRKSSSQYRNGINHPYYGKSSPMKGRNHTEETRKIISEAGQHRVVSDEAKEKIRKAKLGKKASNETKEKLKIAHTGQKQSAETIEKRRQKMLGSNHPGWIAGIDKDWLYEQYVVLVRTAHDIAKMLSIDVSTVCERLRKHNIPIRNASESKMGKNRQFDMPKEDLVALVWKMPVSQIAKIHGVSGNTVKQRCRQYDIPTPSRGYWKNKIYKVYRIT